MRNGAGAGFKAAASPAADKPHIISRRTEDEL
jgi:hypothetical protein